jgi:hypothetical protein
MVKHRVTGLASHRDIVAHLTGCERHRAFAPIGI